MRKKILALLLCISCSLSLLGCQNNSSSEIGVFDLDSSSVNIDEVITVSENEVTTDIVTEEFFAPTEDIVYEPFSITWCDNLEGGTTSYEFSVNPELRKIDYKWVVNSSVLDAEAQETIGVLEPVENKMMNFISDLYYSDVMSSDFNTQSLYISTLADVCSSNYYNDYATSEEVFYEYDADLDKNSTVSYKEHILYNFRVLSILLDGGTITERENLNEVENIVASDLDEVTLETNSTEEIEVESEETEDLELSDESSLDDKLIAKDAVDSIINNLVSAESFDTLDFESKKEAIIGTLEVLQEDGLISNLDTSSLMIKFNYELGGTGKINLDKFKDK